MRTAWTIVPAAPASMACAAPARCQVAFEVLDMSHRSASDAFAEMLPMLPLLALAALAVGGLLRPTAGRWVASFVTGGVVGFFVWWTAAAYLMALLAALVAWLFALAGTLLWHPRPERGRA
jgi:hypothetical protein